MAMNKAEKARMEALETELAFRWPTAPEPKPMTREEIGAGLVTVKPGDSSVYRERKVTLGWVQNVFCARVEPGWSDGHTHGRGNHTGDSGSQNMGRIYRTEAEAALAMRWEMCRDFAKKLRAVDRLIESPTP